MTISFFQTLWGVCCGTRLFPVLRSHSAVRVFWHLFVLSVLCAAVIAFCDFRRLSREWRDYAAKFTASFGGAIEFSPRGITPEKSPDTPRFIGLPGGGGLLYSGAAESAPFPAGFLSRAPYFSVWSPCYFAAGIRIDGRQWQLRLVTPDQSIVTARVDTEAIPAFLRAEAERLRDGRDKWRLPQTRLSSDELLRVLKSLSAIGFFLSELIGIFTLGVFCTLFFAGISRLTGAAALRGLNGWDYWKIGVYAGFPGMLIGSAVEALDLPFLSYGVIYSLALVIYWVPASISASGDAPGSAGGAPRT